MFMFRKNRQPVEVKELTAVEDFFPSYLLIATVILLIIASFIPNTPAMINGIICMVLFIIGLVVPQLFKRSESGPGSMAAPWIAALICGAVAGALCQRSRLCMAGGIRDAVMFKDFNLLTGFAALFVTIVVGNLILSRFNLGFAEQAVAHTDGLWNFLGMVLVGWGSILLGGCPLRQLILTGEGNTDSAMAVLGMVFGAALCHNLKLASSADGPTLNGKIAVAIGFAVLAVISVTNFAKKEK
jgi:YedE family putative selenium metabolism protein